MTNGSSSDAVVAYGRSSLADVMPSVLASLGVDGEPNVLGLRPAHCVVVLLVDGLGWNLLRGNAGYAPFLSSLAGRSLTAGFPTTTAASITSLGTGRPPGEHGITGYTTRAAGVTEPVNWLTWRGAQSGRDLSEDLPPARIQPMSTAFDRAERAGIRATVVSAPAFRNSGLTGAALWGAHYVPAFTAADTATGVATAARERGGLIYCYNADLDLIGHVHGSRSQAWLAQLQLIDRGAELLAERLPDQARLLITADHGMVDVPDEAKIDYDDDPTLHEGVDLIAGEARVRYLYVAAGQLDAVRERWTHVVGDRTSILTRDEAIDRGWYGPVVTAAARERIGDLIVLAESDVAIVRRRAESRSSALIGHHGALTDDELLVPLLSFEKGAP
jgi:predicted AlkP superfamily pyrophosphatase or phosphodiesterase